MPRIPQYRQPTEAPNLSFPQVVDGGALAAPGRALVGLGGAITGMASNLQQDMEAQQRKARGEATWYGNQSLIQHGALDDADWLEVQKANPDPNTWLAEYQKRRQPRQQQFLGTFANDPEMAQEFQTRVQTADTADMVRRQQEVDRANVKYAEGILDTAAASSVEQSIRNPDQKDNYRIVFDGTVDGLVDAGRITREQGKLAKQNYRDNLGAAKFSFDVETPEGRRALPGQMGMASSVENFADRIAGSESGGNDKARNNVPGSGGVGHFGRLQFSRGRLDEARRAGVMPANMTPEEFLQNPSVQRAVEVWHFQDIDQHIAAKGYVSQGYDLDGMRAVAHLGGKGGLDKYISSGGVSDPADANGTTLSAYYRRYQNGGGTPAKGGKTLDPVYADMSPEARLKLMEKMPGVIAQNERAYAAELGASITQDVTDQIAVVSNGGDWRGQTYGVDDYVAAFGPDKGPQQYEADRAQVSLATEINNLNGMTPEQGAAVVSAAQAAIPEGPGAAEAYNVFKAKSDAWNKVLANRADDPGGQALRVPSIAAMYDAAANDPAALVRATTANLAYQASLGIPAEKQRPLPKEYAKNVIDRLNSVQDPRQKGIAALSVVRSFGDPALQVQVLDQLTEQGKLPYGIKFAAEAAASGRENDAAALAEAAMYEGELPVKNNTFSDKDFKAAVETNIAGAGGNGSDVDTVYFGTDTGDAGSLKAREEASTLVNKLAKMYLATNKFTDPDSAIKAATKTLMGDITAYKTSDMWFPGGRAPVAITLPVGEDPKPYQAGFNALMPNVEAAIKGQAERLLGGLPADMSPEQKAVAESLVRRQADTVLSGGKFEEYGAGSFGFRDPYTNKFVADKEGRPLVFPKEQVLSAGRGAPTVQARPVPQPMRVAPATGGRAPVQQAAPVPLIEAQPTAKAGVFDLMDQSVNAARGGPPLLPPVPGEGQRPPGTLSPRTRRIDKPRTGRF